MARIWKISMQNFGSLALKLREEFEVTDKILLDFAQTKFAQPSSPNPSSPNVVVCPINPINGSPNTKKILLT